MLIRNLIISIRPEQWYKNLLLLAGIVFSANIFNASAWATAILALVYFCMLSAGEYLVNDIIDRERDRLHPAKKQRPIASGRLKVRYAFSLALLLTFLSLLGAFLTIGLGFFTISASYAALMIFYSLILKHVIAVDVLIVSAGFVIRAAAGALAIDVFVSPWLIVCTFLLALLLALEKRWHELAMLADQASVHRPNLAKYSTQKLKPVIATTAGAVLLSYLLYTVFSGNYGMLLTVPFVVYGLFRYLHLVHRKGWSAEPEAVFRDKAMLANLGIWGLVVLAVIAYGILY